MKRPLHVLIASAVLGSLLSVSPAAQTLSQQVLQLLTRVNTWTAKNTFLDLRLAIGVPSDTTARIYSDTLGNLYYNGVIVASSSGAIGPHNLLSATHPDTLAAAAVRGATVVGNSTPAWSRLLVGPSGTFLRSDGTDVSWGIDGSQLTNLPAANLTGAYAALSGAAITALNASNLSSGTVPLARLSGITFTEWGSSGCGAGDAPVYNGATWVCTPVGSGSGSVTSVALAAPAIFTVSGSPVTTAGTLTLTLATQVANRVWAGPTVAPDASPTFRALVNADLPLSGVAAGTYPSVTVNTAGVVTAATASVNLATVGGATILPMANGGTGVAVSADDTVLIGSGVAWVAQTLPNCPSPGALGYTTATNLFNCVTTGGPTHSILSATHTDSLASAVSRGSVIVGNSTPVWAELNVGTIGQLFTTDGVDATWSSTVARGTITTSQPWIWTQTWNDGAVTFTGVRVNITSTASAAASLIEDWQIGGTSVLALKKNGELNMAGVTFANLGTPANGTLQYCSNCDPATSPCTTGGASTGSMAFRQNSAWKCF